MSAFDRGCLSCYSGNEIYFFFSYSLLVSFHIYGSSLFHVYIFVSVVSIVESTREHLSEMDLMIVKSTQSFVRAVAIVMNGTLLQTSFKRYDLVFSFFYSQKPMLDNSVVSEFCGVYGGYMDGDCDWKRGRPSILIRKI